VSGQGCCFVLGCQVMECDLSLWKEPRVRLTSTVGRYQAALGADTCCSGLFLETSWVLTVPGLPTVCYLCTVVLRLLDHTSIPVPKDLEAHKCPVR
jgi:hypothetical protein